MPIPLNVKAIENAGPGDHTIRNRTGLILRVEPTRRCFRLRAKLSGKGRIWQLGEYPRPTVADVGKLHEDCRHAIRQGEDPQPLIDRWHLKAIPGAHKAGGPTVADVVAEFMVVAKRERKRPEAAQAAFDLHVLRWIGDVPVAALEKRHFVELYDRIVARGRLVQANRVQALVRQAFAVAADRDLIQSVPAMPRAPAGGDEAPRERVLDDAEIAALWRGLDKLSPPDKRQKISRPLVLALKLALVTAQRRGEIAAARWSDIVIEPAPPTKNGKPAPDLRTWRIPDTKTGRPHAVPLSPLACQLLDELRALAGESDLWFPSKKTGEANKERDRSITRAARDARDELQMSPWTTHDLRRTARTGMARLGIRDEVGERVLNHAQGNRMLAVYNQHAYREEMRVALDTWAEHLSTIISAKAAK